MTAEIGALIRRARLQQSLSLRSLASAIGVSASLISQVETGKTQPSVSTLYELSNYLGLSMDDLLGSGPSNSRVKMRSSDHTETTNRVRSPIQRASENPFLVMDNGVRWERLAVGESGPVDPLLVRYSPGASSSIEGKLMRHSGFEYAYILEGELTLQLEFDTFVLHPGDSLQFDSVRPHMYTNRGKVEACGIWYVVGRKQQNQAMPAAPNAESSMTASKTGRLTSAVDVLHIMDHFNSGTA